MKTKLFFFVAILGLITSCNNNAENASLKIVIDRNTTENDLAEMIEGVRAANINLSIAESTYNEKGGLEKVVGEVEFPNQNSASFNSDRVGRIVITRDLNSKEGGLSVVVHKRWF